MENVQNIIQGYYVHSLLEWSRFKPSYYHWSQKKRHTILSQYQTTADIWKYP